MGTCKIDPNLEKFSEGKIKKNKKQPGIKASIYKHLKKAFKC